MKPKLYAFQSNPIRQLTIPQTTTETVVCKGGKKAKLNYAMYEQVLSSLLPVRQTARTFRSYNHEIYMIETTKQVLSVFDDKRWWVDKFTSLPYGHPDTVVVVENSLQDHCYAPTTDNNVKNVLHDHSYALPLPC